MSAKDRVASYPVLTATLLAPLVAYLGGKLGLDLDDAQAAWLAGAVLAAGSTIATNLVRSRRTLPDPEATRSNSQVEVRPTTYRVQDETVGGYSSGDTPASELRPPTTGVRRAEPPRPQPRE